MRSMQSLHLAVFFALAIASIAFATQQAVAQQPLQIEEVIVTAQKRAENVQDIPVSVSAIGAGSIEQAGIQSSSDVVRVSPSLTITEGNKKTASSFSIRGIGTNSFSIGVEQAVAMVVDDVAMIQQGQSLANLVDIERIEVLRGPQSTLFGKASSAGAISVTTKDPAEEFEGSIEFSYTDESEERVLAALSGPISHTLAYRVSGYWNDNEGWGRNLSTGSNTNASDSYGFRGKLRWDISDTVSATLIALVGEEDNACCIRTFREVGANAALFGGLVRLPFATGITPSDDNTAARNDISNDAKTESEGVSLRLSFDIGEFSLLSISAYDTWDFVSESEADQSDLDIIGFARATLQRLPPGTPPPVLGAYRALAFLSDPSASGGYKGETSREIEFMSQEFRLVSPLYDNFDYLVGLYYSDTQIDASSFRDLPLAPQNFVSGAGIEQMALFGQLNRHFTDRTTASFGLRWFQEDITGEVTNFLSPMPTTVAGGDSDSGIVGKVSLSHFLTDDTMGFVSFTRGYKGQAFDLDADFDAFGAANPVEPEDSNAYELGIKSTLWHSRLQLNVTAFATTYENYQVRSSSIGASGEPIFALVNAGELETQGIELETSALLSETLTLNLNAAYIDAEVNDFVGAPCYASQPQSDTFGEDCYVVNPNAPLASQERAQDIDGGTLPNTPEWKYTVALNYDQPLNNMPFDFFANFAYVWQDETRFEVDQNPLLIQDGFGIANLRLGIRDKDERYQVTAFANNLFDEVYAGDLIDASLLFRDTAVLHMLPRNSQRYLGLKARFNF